MNTYLTINLSEQLQYTDETSMDCELPRWGERMYIYH